MQGIAEAQPSCEVVLSAMSSVPIGALNVELDYSQAAGTFDGVGTAVDCSDLSGAGLTAFFDDDTGLLKLGWVDSSGIGPSTPLTSCLFTPTTQAGPQRSDFRVTTTNASDLSASPISVNVAITQLNCSPDVSCGDVNGDGQITATDALSVLKKSVGIDTTFQCSGTSGGTTTTTMTPVTTTTTTTLAPVPHTLSVTKLGTGTGGVISNPAGISCGADCQQTYTTKIQVTLTATPVFGSTFDGWAGDVPVACNGMTGPCTLRTGRDRAITATFTQALSLCPQNGPITDLRNDCSGLVYLYVAGGVGEGLVTDGTGILIVQTDGIDTLAYLGNVTGARTFSLSSASGNDSPFLPLDSGFGSLSSNGGTLNFTVGLGGQIFPFNGATWVQTSVLAVSASDAVKTLPQTLRQQNGETEDYFYQLLGEITR